MNFNSDNVKEERAKNVESNQEQIVSDEEIFEQAKIKAEDIISIPELIKGIITFAEALGDMHFYPYQKEVSERIVYDLVTDGGNTIAVLFARQTGKSFSMSCLVPSLCVLLPLVAQTLEAKGVENHNLLKFRKGLWVGVYGPDYERAGIIGNKINTVLGSKNSKLILSIPEIGMTFPERLNRYIGHLPRGSRINVKSANKRVSIEGDTYHLVITDETQAISDYVLKKSISPFLSSTNGTKVHLGSAYPLKVYFYDVLSLNKREDINRAKKLKCHFDIPYQVAEKYNKNYKKYVEKEKNLLGEHSIVGTRNITVKENGLIKLYSIEELYTKYSLLPKDNNGNIICRNLDLYALSSTKAIIIKDRLELENYHLTSGQRKLVSALKNVGEDLYYGYRKDLAKKLGWGKIKTDSYISNLNLLLEESQFYDIKPEWNKIEKIIRHKNKHNIYRVSNGQGETVVTECHSLIKLDGDKLVPVVVKDSDNLYRIKKFPEIDYLVALNFDELLSLPVLKGRGLSTWKTDRDFIYLTSRRFKNPTERIPRDILVGDKTYDALCRIFGAYVSEGHVNKRDCMAGISNSNLKWLKQLQKDVKLVFNFDAPIRVSKDLRSVGYKKMYKLMLERKLIGVFLSFYAGQGSGNKKVPYFLFNVDKKYLEQFIKFAVDGDGHRELRKNFICISYTTKSVSLASGMYTLFLINGSGTRIYRSKKGAYIVSTQDEGINGARNNYQIVKDKNSYEFVYDLQVANAHNFVDSMGNVLVHNSDEFRMSYENYWPIDKGMLISEDFLVNKLGKDYPTSTYNKKDEHVIGIDIGKIQDPTVITVLKPDWENPIVVDSDSKTVRYVKPISNWYEIFGDDYDSQFYQICDFLGNYKWSICVIDATGVGQGMYDRLNNKYSKQGKRVIPFVFTRPDKSLLYSLLLRELLAERVVYPNNSAAQRQRKQQKFVSQLLDLSKKIEGGYLTVISTSDTGHDDYPSSLALAVWGVEGDNIAIDIEEVSVGESFYKKSKMERNFWKN